MEPILNILREYQAAIAFLSGLSVVIFVLSLFSVPWMVCRIPENYFLGSLPDTPGQKSKFVRGVTVSVKNFLGAGIFLVGFVLLFIPGQGLLTMLLGLILMDFPGKKKMLQRLVAMENVQASLNWIRRKRKVQPLRFQVSKRPRKGRKRG